MLRSYMVQLKRSDAPHFVSYVVLATSPTQAEAKAMRRAVWSHPPTTDGDWRLVQCHTRRG